MENRSSPVSMRVTVRLTEGEDRYLKFYAKVFKTNPSTLMRKLLQWEMDHDTFYPSEMSDIV